MRTDIVYVGANQPLQRSMAPEAPQGDAAAQGRALFIGLNCAACHGLKGQGGVFAPVIVGTDAGALATNTRRNPPGMPAFAGLTEEDFKALAAYLQAATQP